MSQIRIGSIAVLAILFITTLSAGAQYNKNFQSVYNTGWTSSYVSGNARDVVIASPGYQVVLTELTELPTNEGYTSWDNVISLKKIDFYGNTMWDMSYELSDTTRKIEPWRLIKTQDGGFIIVGRALQHSGIINPCAFNVDSTGKMMWTNIYYSNRLLYQDEAETSVAKVEDDPSGDESYIIVRSGSRVNPYWNFEDVTVNALRIRGDGSLMWNKRYDLQGRTGDDSVAISYPKTITYVHNDTSKFYFIAGHQLSHGYSNKFDTALFYMGINKDGNIVRAYTTIYTKGYPKDEGAIYDDRERAIVLTYSNTRSGLVDSQQIINKSQIGLLKLDATFLSVQFMKHYYAYGMVDHLAARVVRNTSDDAYAIATNVHAGDNKDPWNISVLKTDKSGTPQQYAVYNFARYTHVNSMVSLEPTFGSEEYELVGYRHSDYGNLLDTRIMQVDANLNTCGALSLDPAEMDYSPVRRYKTHVPFDTSGSVKVSWERINVDFYMEDCTSDNSIVFKQGPTTGVKEIGVSKLAVYPTLLQTDEHRLTIDAAMTSTEQINATMYSIDRRVVATHCYRPLAGSNKLTWDLPQMTAGTYIVIVKGKGGKKLYTG